MKLDEKTQQKKGNRTKLEAQKQVGLDLINRSMKNTFPVRAADQ